MYLDMKWLWLAILVSVLMPRVARAGDTSVTISVPGRDIITTSDFSGPPDDGGGFDFGVLTAATPIRTANCDQPKNYLNVTMSDTTPTDDASALTPAQKTIIAKKIAFYHDLIAKEATNGKVVLHIKTPDNLLYMKNGHLYAPQCAVALDTEGLDLD